MPDKIIIEIEGDKITIKKRNPSEIEFIPARPYDPYCPNPYIPPYPTWPQWPTSTPIWMIDTNGTTCRN